MQDYWDDQWTPKPDRHGAFMPSQDSTNLVLPYGDQHGKVSYPQDNSGVVNLYGDKHENTDFAMHPGTPKPGSFKEQQTPQAGTDTARHT